MAPKDEQAYWEANFWEALETRDAHMDGVFFFAVITTGVYCRPSCPSRRPRRENVIFFQRRDAAERAGFRACLRCKPDRERCPRRPIRRWSRRSAATWSGTWMKPSRSMGSARQLNLSPFHLQRTFKAATGITPRAYADFCRLESFKGGLREGRTVTTALYDAGYGSSSRLYERAASQLGMTPTAYRRGGAGLDIRYDILDTPAGMLLVARHRQGRVRDPVWRAPRRQLEESVRAEFPAADVQPRPGVSEPVGRPVARAPGRATAEAGRAARHPGHGFPAARLGVSANDPLRQHAIVWRDCQGASGSRAPRGPWRAPAPRIR